MEPTIIRDWQETPDRQNTSGPQAVVTSTIAQLNVIDSRTIPSTKTFSNAQPTTLTVFQRLTLESCFTYLERSPLDRYQQLPAPNKRYIDANYYTNESNTKERRKTVTSKITWLEIVNQRITLLTETLGNLINNLQH